MKISSPIYSTNIMTCYKIVKVTATCLTNGSTNILVDHGNDSLFEEVKIKIQEKDPYAKFDILDSTWLYLLKESKETSVMRESLFDRETIEKFIHQNISFETIKSMNGITDKFGNTLSHYFASHGFQFTIEQLIELGDPKSNSQTTVSMEMAACIDPRLRKSFTFDEIIQLGNPINQYSESLGYLSTLNGRSFSAQEIVFLEKDCEIKRMALEIIGIGFLFSDDDVALLSNSGYSKELLISRINERRKSLMKF